jgi:uncharacterized protein (TIGR02145 family)
MRAAFFLLTYPADATGDNALDLAAREPFAAVVDKEWGAGVCAGPDLSEVALQIVQRIRRNRHHALLASFADAIVDSVTDADGNVCHAIQIGSQVWTVENRWTTKLNDGTQIPHVTDGGRWSFLTTPGYCFYGNTTNTSDKTKYGVLYNWSAVNTGKLAPAGWHVPSDSEWDTLQNFLIANGYNYDGTRTGNKIAKAMAAKTDWNSFVSAGAIGNDLSKNNASGFSALPAVFVAKEVVSSPSAEAVTGEVQRSTLRQTYSTVTSTTTTTSTWSGATSTRVAVFLFVFRGIRIDYLSSSLFNSSRNGARYF